jgi:Coenzyme PQQ synthesis protein D (PqqD)
LALVPEQFKDATVRVPEHVVYRSFEAETLLLNLDTGQYHGLNPTGGRMLELLKETDGSVREATERLAGEVEMAPEEIADDLASFCADLAERGLIEVDDSGERSGNSS